MNIISRVISATFDSVKRRKVKIKSLGNSVETGIEAGPYGTDSNPIAGMDAIYAETADKGKQVIIGYINRNQLAGPGEYRTYSTDSDGNVKFSIWLKADGTCEIGGNTKHMTRFEELESGFNTLKSDFNAHVHPGVTPGGSSTGPIVTPSTADISGAKIEEVKTL